MPSLTRCWCASLAPQPRAQCSHERVAEPTCCPGVGAAGDAELGAREKVEDDPVPTGGRVRPRSGALVAHRRQWGRDFRVYRAHTTATIPPLTDVCCPVSLAGRRDSKRGFDAEGAVELLSSGHAVRAGKLEEVAVGLRSAFKDALLKFFDLDGLQVIANQVRRRCRALPRSR